MKNDTVREQVSVSDAELATLQELLKSTNLPTAEQAAVIMAPLEPVLVVAGAGAGKTETLSQRIVYLCADKTGAESSEPAVETISPAEILCLTFTRKAASEIAERAASAIARSQAQKYVEDLPQVMTYNGYASQLISEYGARIGINTDATLAPETSLYELAVQAVSETAVVEKSKYDSTAKNVLELADGLRDHGESVSAYRDYLQNLISALPQSEVTNKDAKTIRENLSHRLAWLPALERYLELKEERTWLNFADQVALALKLVQQPDVVNQERSKYRAVLLDEFQDTSPNQLEFLSKLFGDGHAVMAVGDPNQAIYGFRGASANALNEFKRKFAAASHEVTELQLTVSWRNSPKILHAANTTVNAPGVIGSASKTDYVKVLELKDRSQIVPGLDIHPGHLSAGLYLEDHEEAAAIADYFKRLCLDSDGSWKTLDGKPVTAAILCRKRAQFEALATALAEAGVPFDLPGLEGVLDSPEVQDFRAFLQVVIDSSALKSWQRLLLNDRFNIGLSDLKTISDYAKWQEKQRRGKTVKAVKTVKAETATEAVVETAKEEALPPIPGLGISFGETVMRLAGSNPDKVLKQRLTPAGEARISELANLVLTVKDRLHLPLMELLNYVRRLLNLDIEVMAVSSRSNPLAHIDAFMATAATLLSVEPQASLKRFLTWLNLAQQLDKDIEEVKTEVVAGAVQLATVHSAKGLEWDFVAVPGLRGGSFPSTKFGSQVEVTADGILAENITADTWIQGLKVAGKIPWALRSDADYLRDWHYQDQESYAGFRSRAGIHFLAEDRRLFYVAVTRAKTHLFLSSSVYKSTGVQPSQPSVFLLELKAAAGGTGPEFDELIWPADIPSIKRENNSQHQETLMWPWELSAKQQKIQQLAADVVTAQTANAALSSEEILASFAQIQEDAKALLHGGDGDQDSQGSHGDHSGQGESELGSAVSLATDPLLSDIYQQYLAEQKKAEEVKYIKMPLQLSASALISYVENPQRYKENILRPMPYLSSADANVGTVVHAAIEHYYNQVLQGTTAQLLQPSGSKLAENLVQGVDILGVFAQAGYPAHLLSQQVRSRAVANFKKFLNSEWPAKSIFAVEHALRYQLEGVPFSGSIDAVFFDEEKQQWLLIDWKSAGATKSETDELAKRIQLSLYRLAWAELKKVELSKIAIGVVYLGGAELVEQQFQPLSAAELSEKVAQMTQSE